jgi:hypothetical protein
MPGLGWLVGSALLLLVLVLLPSSVRERLRAAASPAAPACGSRCATRAACPARPLRTRKATPLRTRRAQKP